MLSRVAAIAAAAAIAPFRRAAQRITRTGRCA